jgi:hypothetical protein
MIQCRRSDLMARCGQRGVRWEDAVPCIVSQDGEIITVDETHAAYPAGPKHGVSLAQKAANFSASAVRHIAGGMPRATEEQVAARFAI